MANPTGGEQGVNSGGIGSSCGFVPKEAKRK